MGELAERREIVTPARMDDVLETMRMFDEFKQRVLKKDDYVEIQGRPYVKKSGWLKYALACQLSLELREERVETRDGDVIYHMTYRAVHLPTGRYADAVGSASKREIAHKRRIPEDEVFDHDIRALAQTRAMERAISNLVGGGELGAEELMPVEGAKAERPRGASMEEVMDVVERYGGLNEFEVEELENQWRVKPKRFLGSLWREVNREFEKIGGSWDREEGVWRIGKSAPVEGSRPQPESRMGERSAGEEKGEGDG